MNKHFFSLTLIIFSILLVLPQAQAQEASLLWKIEGNDLNEPSWLYGTMHLMCGEDFSVSEKAVSYLKKSDVLALEIDLSDSNIQQLMMQHSILPEGETLSSYMNDEEHKAVDQFMTQHYGSGLDAFDSMKPLALTSMAMMALVQCEQGFQSYDGHLMQIAIENEIEITALETVEFQFGIFDQIPLEDQVFELADMIKNPDDGREEFSEMTRIYLSQDINEMYRMIIDDSFWNQYRDLLLYERNRAWIPEISKLSAEKSVFYAVGAGHMAGEYGVINLLREAGYTVTAVEISM